MEAATFFLGVIAVSLAVIAVLMSVVAAALLKFLRQATVTLGELQQQSREIGNKAQVVIGNLQTLTSVANIFSLIFKKRN
ncbi:MAG: hypothetical protein K6347_02700 [Campylobacterales bacterium]